MTEPLHPRATRALVSGALLLLATAGMGAAVASLVAGKYGGGGGVVLRDWLVDVNLVVAGAQLLVVGFLVVGARQLPPSRARQVALSLLTATVGLLVIVVAVPSVFGTGPWRQDDPAVRLLTLSTLGAPATRAAAAAALLWALSRAAWHRGVVAVAAIDAGVCLYAIATTPIEVVARVHPYSGSLASLPLWLVAASLLVLPRRS